MMFRRPIFWLAAPLIAMAGFMAGCGSDSAPGNPDGGGGSDTVVLTVDPTVEPSTPDLPVGSGDDPRPLAAIASEHGHQAEFVENELWIQPASQTELDDFLARWNGTVIGEYDPSEFGLGGEPVQYLVRADATGADTTDLGDLISELSGGGTGDFRVSSQAALSLIAANAQEAASGLEVGMNWVGQGSSFIDSESMEAPAGDPSGYSPDAFTWASHAVGNTQDIGVAEAWRMLELAGRLDNRVKLAILDMGFSNINDIRGEKVVISNVPFVENPMEVENLLGCGGGGCPWHGTNVASAAMGLADDGFGGAGPAGPVADPILVFTLYDYFTSIGALAAARAAGADIANMSYGAPIPGILSWTALPFEIATLALRDSGMLIFASAGNAGANVDEETCVLACWENTLHTPCENAGVICVGGLGFDSRNRAGNSNYGLGSVDIFAPYTLLVGPDPSQPANYANLINGTSFSSPFAAGVAALIWAADPGLTADEVEAILFDTSHSSSDGLVNRYVNAADAVRAALGDAPPYVEITSPTDGSSFPRGSASIPFAAIVDDVEDPSPTVSWTSSRDGTIGSGTSFAKTNLSSGVHVITATARDGFGNESTDQISITITNSAPTLSIDSPGDGATFYESQTISFQGSSFDPNDLAPLPNANVSWIINGTNRGTGHSLSLAASVLGAGSHSVRFRGTDGDLSGEDQIQVIVENDPVNVPPSVAILTPQNGASLWVDTYDPLEQAWFVNVAFTGTATDTEDGALNGTDVVWKARRAGVKDETLGTGTGFTARLYSRSSFATNYTIILTATDSGGVSSTTSIQVTVNILSR